MTEHLPECPVEKRLRAGRTVGSQTCICAALRACEQRVLSNLDNAAVYARIMKVLDDNGINMQDGSIHSWRCFDKERYPEPCSCAGEVVVEILAVLRKDRND